MAKLPFVSKGKRRKPVARLPVIVSARRKWPDHENRSDTRAKQRNMLYLPLKNCTVRITGIMNASSTFANIQLQAQK